MLGCCNSFRLCFSNKRFFNGRNFRALRITTTMQQMCKEISKALVSCHCDNKTKYNSFFISNVSDPCFLLHLHAIKEKTIINISSFLTHTHHTTNLLAKNNSQTNFTYSRRRYTFIFCFQSNLFQCNNFTRDTIFCFVHDSICAFAYLIHFLISLHDDDVCVLEREVMYEGG